MESNARVVDALVIGLAQLKQPVTDPATCRTLVERMWETGAAAQVFECWRAAAAPDTLIEAALTAPPTLRALALHALGETLQPEPRQLMVTRPITPPAPAPMPGATSGQMRAAQMTARRPETQRIQRPSMDAATRMKLLASATETLSKAGAVSSSTTWTTREALWDLAEHKTAVAVQAADRIRGVL